MLIIPAIDLINGKCVRLTEGDFNKKKEYFNNPLEAAFYFKNIGAKRIHIVDLEGAKTGISKNREIIKKIKKETNLIIQTGGGIRTENDVKELVNSGIDYLILGTILIENLKIVNQWIDTYGEKFMAGIDIKNNTIKTKGWTKDETIDPIQFGNKLKKIGFKSIVFTDISKDGKLQGPNIETTKNFALKTKLKVILSGGISNIKDIHDINNFTNLGIIGIIIGKAFYEGKINLKEAIELYQNNI